MKRVAHGEAYFRGPIVRSGLFWSCARQGALTWRCDPTGFVEVKSSTHPTGGSVSRTARVPNARWDLKEAAGKALARRALKTNAMGVLMALVLAAAAGFVMNVDPTTSEIASRATVGNGDIVSGPDGWRRGPGVC